MYKESNWTVRAEPNENEKERREISWQRGELEIGTDEEGKPRDREAKKKSV